MKNTSPKILEKNLRKKCSDCGEEKNVDDFMKGRAQCRKCRNRVKNVWQQNNPERIKKYKEKRIEIDREYMRNFLRNYRISQPEKVRNAQKKYYNKNKEISIQKTKEWRHKNIEKARQHGRDSYQRRKLSNPEKLKQYQREYCRKLRENPIIKLHMRMSTGIRKSLQGKKNGFKWETLVGYTRKQLAKHLEKQFKDGMCWENISKWHIDHIIPKSAFHITSANDIDFKKCWALNNLQPLWIEDNMKKGNKLDKPFQPSLPL
jgi:hypothetical protein